MEKRLIVTRADNNIKSMTKITHPILKRYAKMCDADFKVIRSNKGLHPHYRIMQIGEYFNVYDRILVIDSDVLLLNTIPNIFELVPVSHIGTIYEDKLTRQEDRRNRIKKIQEERGNVNWKEGYINTGFILFSKEHADLFDYNEDDLYLDLGYDDVFIKYNIEKKGYKVFELPCEWNFMSMFMDVKDRTEAFVLHYAGQGFAPILSDRSKQIEQDYLVLKKYGLAL